MASVTCPNCQTVTAEGTASCPGCGNALSGVAPTTSPAANALASISSVDRLVGGGTLVLFIALFLPWFKVSFSFGSASASGLTAHGYLYITLIVSLFILGLVVAETLGLWKLPASSALSRDQILVIGTAINFVLVLLAFLLKPGGPGVGWDFGAFIALAAAVVAVFPMSWPIIQARRSK
jgi:hypothetical protein